VYNLEYKTNWIDETLMVGSYDFPDANHKQPMLVYYTCIQLRSPTNRHADVKLLLIMQNIIST